MLLLLLLLLENVTVYVVVCVICTAQFLMLMILLWKLCWEDRVWVTRLVLACFQWLYRYSYRLGDVVRIVSTGFIEGETILKGIQTGFWRRHTFLFNTFHIGPLLQSMRNTLLFEWFLYFCVTLWLALQWLGPYWLAYWLRDEVLDVWGNLIIFILLLLLVPNHSWTSLLLLLLYKVLILQILFVLSLAIHKLARFIITELQTVLQLHVI